jgi:hypothetical protein
MSSKSLIRYAIAVAIAALLVIGLLPVVGIPTSQILPPPAVYGGAKEKTKGVVTGKKEQATPNPFRVGDMVYWVDYKFTATAPPLLFDKNAGKKREYQGKVAVKKAFWDLVVPNGSTVPVRYEKSYPVINGIDSPMGGRSVAQGSGWVSGWILYMLLIGLLGYVIAPLLERIMLRESY